MPALADLHALYVSTPSIDNSNDLLEAIRDIALNVLRDEDAVQDFLIRLLPDLSRLSEVRDLNAWLRVRLTWARDSFHRRRYRCKEIPASDLDFANENGEQIVNDEKLEILAQQHADRVHKADPQDQLDAIQDPTIRRAAEMLLHGFTQAETAAALGLTAGAFRSRLRRHREQLSR